MNLNKVFLSGRLTRDPQLRYTPSGSAVADVGLAVNRNFTDASGQRREETCFVDVVLWKRQAETCAKYLRKGSPIFVEGRLNFDSWQTNDGQRRSRLRVVAENFQFMDQPQDRRGTDAASDPTPPEEARPYEAQSAPRPDMEPAPAAYNNEQSYDSPAPGTEPPDDTIPF
jgi:single-strand DNA-binding protein